MKSKDVEWLHSEAKRLTGDLWVPYLSQKFIDACRSATDERKKQLIEKRRTFLFPHFLTGLADEGLE